MNAYPPLATKRRRSSALALLVGLTLASGCARCGGCEGDEATIEAPDVSTDTGADVPADVPPPEDEGVDFYGLRVGMAGESEVRSFLAALGLPCSDGMDEAAGVIRHECRNGDRAFAFSHRETGGEVVRVIVEHAPSGAVQTASLRRVHASVDAGLADYRGVTQSAPAEWGAARVTGEFAVATESTEPAREISEWTTERGGYAVSILRGMGPGVFVEEAWTMPRAPGGGPPPPTERVGGEGAPEPVRAVDGSGAE